MNCYERDGGYMARINIELNRKIDMIRQKILDFILLNNINESYEKLVYSIQDIELSPENEFERGYLKSLADILTAVDIFHSDEKVFTNINKNQYASAIVGILTKNNSMGHQELANELGISKSGLSNHVDRLSKTKIIDEWKVGKEKIYSLTKSGALFYEWHQLNKKKMETDETLGIEWFRNTFTPTVVIKKPADSFSRMKANENFDAFTSELLKLAKNTKNPIIDIIDQNIALFRDSDKLLLSLPFGEKQ